MLAIDEFHCESIAASGTKLVAAHRACAMRHKELQQQHMCTDENLHLGQSRALKDDVVGCGAINNEEGNGDRHPLGCRTNRDREMDASNGLDNITREAHKGYDASVEHMSRDLELVESINKHYIDRAASVHQDTPNV
ncbi:unnamed protein product [Prunus armeniaca]